MFNNIKDFKINFVAIKSYLKNPKVFIHAIVIVVIIGGLVINLTKSSGTKKNSEFKAETVSQSPTETSQPTEVQLTPTAPTKLITATGLNSDLGGKITLSITFPEAGGKVTGSVVGDCNGTLAGNLTGTTIVATVNGACRIAGVAVPSSAEISAGNVSFASRKVTLPYTGKAGVFSHNNTVVAYF